MPVQPHLPPPPPLPLQRPLDPLNNPLDSLEPRAQLALDVDETGPGRERELGVDAGAEGAGSEDDLRCRVQGGERESEHSVRRAAG